MQQPKKILLSGAVIAAFALYVLQQRRGLSGIENSIALPALPTNPKDTSSSTTPAPPSPHDIPSPPQMSAPSSMPHMMMGMYRDGSYTSSSVDVFYGFLQLKAVVSGGRLSDVQFLRYPNDRSTSVEISQYALPRLRTEAIAVQSATVDIISGATQTSEGFIQALGGVLAQAKNSP